MEHRIQTSRGEVIIRDGHMFQIEIPVHEQLLISFTGEKIEFSPKVWLDNAKLGAYNVSPPQTPPSSSQV